MIPVSRPLAVTRGIPVFIHLDPDIARPRRRLRTAHLPEIYTHRAFDFRQPSHLHPRLSIYIYIYMPLCEGSTNSDDRALSWWYSMTTVSPAFALASPATPTFFTLHVMSADVTLVTGALVPGSRSADCGWSTPLTVTHCRVVCRLVSGLAKTVETASVSVSVRRGSCMVEVWSAGGEIRRVVLIVCIYIYIHRRGDPPPPPVNVRGPEKDGRSARKCGEDSGSWGRRSRGNGPVNLFFIFLFY